MNKEFSEILEYWFPRVPDEERSGLEREIAFTNFRRLRLLSWFILTLMVFFIPFTYFMTLSIVERAEALSPELARDFILNTSLVLRLVLVAGALVVLFAFKVPKSPADIKPYHRYVNTGAVFLGLIIFSVLNGMNLAITYVNVNGYLIALFAVAAFFRHSLQKQLVMFTITWLTILSTYLIFPIQSTSYLISAITVSVLTLIALMTSQAFYASFIREYLHKRTIERNNKKLESANIELKSFAHAASHGLRVPLALIREYCTMLGEKLGEGFDEKTRRITLSIQSNCARMEALIADLLQFSRASRAEIERRDVDLSILARDVLFTLQNRFPEREVEVHIEEGLSAQGDASLLRVALENLFSNAWKYTRSRSPARIAFGREPANGGMAFFVRDNGVGFDMKYAENLFKPFVRLHGRDQYEGTGIGLATVRHIIERHSGSIWVDSAPDRGATFYFTLQ